MDFDTTDPEAAARTDAQRALHLPGARKSWARSPAQLPTADADRRDWLARYALELARAAGDSGPSWSLEGYDTFSSETYPLGRHGTDGCQPSYPDRASALADAQKRLADLERTQPSSSSGGQGGIQDRVYLVHPDGHRERVFPGVTA